MRFTGNREACCSLLVMNGGAAWRLRSFVATESTTNVAFSRSATTALASASRASLTARFPFFISRASNSGGSPAASRAVTCQYSSTWKASMAASRSHTSFRATDCTRPALSPRCTLSHSSGLSL